MTAVAPSAAAAPVRRAGGRGIRLPLATPDAAALTAAIQRMEEMEGGAEPLDALVWRALGWQVERQRMGGKGAAAWVCRSPMALRWQPMAWPSRSLDAARLVVPWRWAWGVGERSGPPLGWAAPRWPVAEGTPFFECNGVTPALALLKAALFAQRHLAMRAADRGAAP